MQQFARVAQHVDFVYCYSIMDAANPWRESSQSSGKDMLHEKPKQNLITIIAHKGIDLTTFFPFDPFKLPKSSFYIRCIYRDWDSVAIDDEESDDDGEEYQQSTEAYDSASGIPIKRIEVSSRHNSSSEELGESFGGMSISPLRTLVPHVH